MSQRINAKYGPYVLNWLELNEKKKINPLADRLEIFQLNEQQQRKNGNELNKISPLLRPMCNYSIRNNANMIE